MMRYCLWCHLELRLGVGRVAPILLRKPLIIVVQIKQEIILKNVKTWFSRGVELGKEQMVRIMHWVGILMRQS